MGVVSEFGHFGTLWRRVLFSCVLCFLRVLWLRCERVEKVGGLVWF